MNAAKKTAKPAAKKTATYEVIRHGLAIKVSVPPSACHGCGGDGCRSCKWTGENQAAK